MPKAVPVKSALEASKTSGSSPTPAVVLIPRGLRIEDDAQYMGVSPWYVEELIRSKQLPALKLCRMMPTARFQKQILTLFVVNGEVSGTVLN
jgi:hypothetical protein